MKRTRGVSGATRKVRKIISSRRGPVARASGSGTRRVSMVPAYLRAKKGEEVKSVDVAPTASTLSTTAVFTALNIPVEGASFYNRVGRKISMKTLLLQGWIGITGSNASAAAADYSRIMVIYDRQPNGAFPALADVLTSYASGGGTTSTALDQLNMNNRDRFLVLMDERLVTPQVGVDGVLGTGTLQTCEINKGKINIKRFIKLKDLEAHYKASAGAIGDLSTGSLFLMTVSNVIAAGNAAWQFNWQARLKYKDA